jgi:hypothetical protein
MRVLRSARGQQDCRTRTGCCATTPGTGHADITDHTGSGHAYKTPKLRLGRCGETDEDIWRRRITLVVVAAAGAAPQRTELWAKRRAQSGSDRDSERPVVERAGPTIGGVAASRDRAATGIQSRPNPHRAPNRHAGYRWSHRRHVCPRSVAKSTPASTIRGIRSDITWFPTM